MRVLHSEHQTVEEAGGVETHSAHHLKEGRVEFEDLERVEDDGGDPTDDAHDEVMIHHTLTTFPYTPWESSGREFRTNLKEGEDIPKEATDDRDELCEHDFIPLAKLLIVWFTTKAMVDRVLFDNGKNPTREGDSVDEEEIFEVRIRSVLHLTIPFPLIYCLNCLMSDDTGPHET
jgi:hypothetical protein